MPFEKGRQKTGGRKKGVTNRRSSRLVDQLKDYGFNFVKEFAQALRDLPQNSAPTGTRYSELKALLPYMAPKLREKEVEFGDPTTENAPATEAISDAALIEALDKNGKSKPGNGRRSVEAGNPVVEVPGSAKADLPDVAGIEGSN